MHEYEGSADDHKTMIFIKESWNHLNSCETTFYAPFYLRHFRPTLVIYWNHFFRARVCVFLCMRTRKIYLASRLLVCKYFVN